MKVTVKFVTISFILPSSYLSPFFYIIIHFTHLKNWWKKHSKFKQCKILENLGPGQRYRAIQNAIVKRESREQCGNRERENCVFAMSARKEYPKKSFKVLCIVLHTSYTYKKREDVGVLFTWRRKPNFFKNICLSEYHI